MILPDLESLCCFEAAATHLNFRVAAKSVSLSPAALSERIRRLEEILGVQLFQRTTRSVTLTLAGERVLRQARRTIEEARRLAAVANNLHASPSFELTVGTRFELGLSWITPSLSLLKANQPQRTLHLQFGDSPELLAQIRKGVLDCAVTSARIITSGLQYEVLHDEDYLFVASATLIASKPLENPQQAADHVLLDLAPDLPLFRYFLDAWHEDEPWMFARVEYLGTTAAVRMRLLEGAGVAVLPHYFVAPDLAGAEMVTLRPDLGLKTDVFRLIWRNGHPHEADLRHLAAELRAIPLR